MNPYVNLAQKTIEHYLQTGKTLPIPDDLPAELTDQKTGCFVSLHVKSNHELRGCIGTILPTQDSLAQEIIHNAISAAFDDPRFLPLTLEELDDLEINVDVLSEPESIDSPEQLDPKKYGVIIRTTDVRSGVLLPDLEGVDTVDQQLDIASQKAGIDLETDQYELSRFTVKRHK